MKNLSAFTKSILFHIIVVIVVSGALFFKQEEIHVTETPIEVAFIADEQPAAGEQEKKPEPVEEAPPPIEEEKPQPAPKALEQPKPQPETAETADKTEETKAEPVEQIKQPDPAPKKPEPPKKIEEKKPEPEPEPAEKEKKPEEDKEKDTKTDFMSVLKNLQESEPTDTTKDGPKLTESPVTDRMTTGELDAFRRQLSQCWSILPGAAQAETLAVNLTILVNRDRTVKSVNITDKARYQSDAFFRAAADNAMRAIQHPDCTPLDLPIDKYNMWKEITLNFDPRTMF